MTQLQELTARLDQTQARLDQTQARLERAEERQQQAERRQLRAERRARLSGACALAALALTALLNVRPAALAQTPGTSLAALLARISALEQKTAPMKTTAITTTGTDGQSHSGYLVTFTGANVQIVNGMGATTGLTDDPYDYNQTCVGNGLGNLIIGYNESRVGDTDPANSTPDARTGSHNLILGVENNYAGVGGLVVGQFNAATAPFASVSGGFGNTASDFCAFVSGGTHNTASGFEASVSGGSGNRASGFYATVSGGSVNTASGYAASISGGGGNTASGDVASVSGGVGNTASGPFASVSGGQNVTESNDYGWSAGGSFHNP